MNSDTRSRRLGVFLWLAAITALLTILACYFFPGKMFRLFAWAVDNIPLMGALFFILPPLPMLFPLLYSLRYRKGSSVPRHAIFPLVFSLACLLAYFLYLGALIFFPSDLD